MYYHVLVETKEQAARGKKNKEVFELDFTEKETVINEVISPYINKQEFQFNGYFLSADQITRVVVRESDKDSSTLSKMANDSLSPGIIMFISKEDAIQYDKYTNDITKVVFKQARAGVPQKENSKSNEKNMEKIDNKKVFVVHGQDNLAKLEVSSYIKDLGFEPIILHEQASGGATIIEKIENYSNVSFGVVLYTPCDIGSKDEENFTLSPRARQNVVFEHGYLIGKLKRGNVCALVKGEVETPNDISGVVYVNLDDHGAWKISLAKELRKAGYDVDMNKVI
ncbi:DNA-binding protein [Shewanella sp. OPT22]|nr:DNA-binding protein [Shewanella sp. OPT22]